VGEEKKLSSEIAGVLKCFEGGQKEDKEGGAGGGSNLHLTQSTNNKLTKRRTPSQAIKTGDNKNQNNS